MPIDSKFAPLAIALLRIAMGLMFLSLCLILLSFRPFAALLPGFAEGQRL